jgi:hypothetical protein
MTITLVSQFAGSAVRSLLLSPAAEADSLNWFFREHLQLPITVGVNTDSVLTLPSYDGRSFMKDTTFYGQREGSRFLHSYSGDPIVLFFDAQGKLQYESGDGGLFSPVLQMLVAHTIGRRVANHVH